MTHNFRWLPDSIIYLILFSLYEMQRHRHRPITLGSALYTCCDLIAFLFIQTFIPLVRFQIILTLVAIFQRGCGRKWPLKWCFLCGAQEKKKGSTWRRTSEDEGQAWSTVSLILDGRKGAKSQIMRKELQFFLKLSGDRENKNDIQLTNERSLT